MSDKAARRKLSLTGGLPRQDLWLLPLIVFGTIVGMMSIAEITARITMPEQLANSCKIADPALGFRYRPNCTAEMKAAEGPSYTNTYNECGYRSKSSCGPLPVGTRRIAIIGSSLGEGHLVPYGDTVAARLSDDLTRLCGLPVEQQNLAARGYTGRRIVLRLQEALKLKPASVLMLALPYDVELQLDDATLPITGGVTARAATSAAAAPTLAGSVGLFVKQNSRALTLAQSVMFNDASTYLSLFLRYGDKADFLRQPFTPAWIERLRRFSLLVGQLASLAHEAGVPLTLVFVPQQGQLTIERRAVAHAAPGGSVDPWALSKALGAIATAQGIDFVDTSKALASYPAPQLLYYPVDGHPTGTGQRVVEEAIRAHYLTKGEPFYACSTAASRQTASSK